MLAAALATGGDPVCSIALFTDFRDPSATVILGTALADTVEAGVGAVAVQRFRRDPLPEAVYGQLVHYDQIGGNAAELVRTATPERSSNVVVIVPWEFDPACQPIPWTQGAAWSPVGREAVWTVELRKREHWVNGTPTFDALFALRQPYPLSEMVDPRRRDDVADRLTPSQFFEFYLSLPTPDELDGNAGMALAPVRRWAGANRQAARLSPAREIVESLSRRNAGSLRDLDQRP